MKKTLVFLDKNDESVLFSRIHGFLLTICHSQRFQTRPFLRKFSHQNERNCLFGKLSTSTCIKTLKYRMQAVFLMQIKNFKSDYQDFDFLRFLGINSEFNHISYMVYDIWNMIYGILCI